MGLKQLETKLSLQGALSGASEVSSAGVVKKFALGGFADGSNGIANNAVIAPLSYIPSAKNTVIFNQKIEESSARSSVESQIEGQPLINNSFSISSFSPEPLAIYSFSKEDIESLKAALYQAYFEDRCSLEFSKALLKKVKQENEKTLSEALKKVEDELKLAESQINLIEKYMKTCLQMNRDFNYVQQQSLSSFTVAKYANLMPDKLGMKGRGGANAISLLSYVGASLETISRKSNTTVMTQLLYLASKQMTNGVSTLILGRNSVYPQRMISNDVKVENFVDVNYGNDSITNLKSLSLQTNPNQSFLYSVTEDVPYTSKLKISTLREGTALQKSAYLIAMLANEMSFSTGLGRLEGTSLGGSFGSVNEYRKSFWGADEQVNDSTTEATSNGSLNDYFVVNEEGQNRLTSEKGILLFDGTRYENTENRRNVFDAFVIESIRSPANKKYNKVQQFSSAQQAALSRFATGEEFFKVLGCREKNVKLMTPRGLFTRMLHDFSETLSLLSSQENSKGQKVVELCMLSILGNSSMSSIDKDTPASIIKRSILSAMAKKALQLQYSLANPQAKNTSSENQVPKSSSSSTKVVTKDKDGKVISDVTVSAETTQSKQSSASSIASFDVSFNTDARRPRYCLDEKLLFEKRFDMQITSEMIGGFANLPVSNDSKDASYVSLSFNVRSFYRNMFQSQEGFIDKLIKIYVDLCDESLKFCDQSNVTSSPVNSNRLTKNSQLDATLLLSMLLESACIMASDFVSARISSESQLQNRGAELSRNRSVGSFDESFEELPIRMLVQAGKNTPAVIASQAFSAIAKAAEGDDIESALLDKNGNLTLPEVEGALPTTVPISYDSLGHTTAASVIDTLYDLVFEREMPALCLSSVFGMLEYFSSVSSKYKDSASQLVGIAKPTEDSKLLINFSQTDIGNKFLSSLNDFSLLSARNRLMDIRSEVSSESGRMPKMTLAELRCINLLMNNLTSNNSTNNFVVIAMPKDFVIKSVNSSYFVSLDIDNTLQDETMKIVTDRKSMFSDYADKSNVTMLIRSPFKSVSFATFNNRQPVSLQDILNEVIVDSSEKGYAFLQKKIDKKESLNVLTNEVVSYLLRKAFSSMSSADLFADNIAESDVMPVNPDSSSIAKNFARSYGLSPGTFDTVFSISPDGTTYVDKERLASLARKSFTISNSSLNVNLPPLKFGEAELFYDLFQTAYFKSGAVSKRVFAVTLFDEISGFLLKPESQKNNGSDTQLVTTSGIVSISKVQSDLSSLDTTKSVPSFDTYTVSIVKSNPLVNK